MRRVFGALVGLVLAPSAFAGDFDVLRGSQSVGPATFARWSGFYAGGQISYSDASADFSNATGPLVSYALRETTLESDFTPSSWPVLGNTARQQLTYGGFIGYNTQWQDLIVGLEANYNQSNFHFVAPVSPIGRITPADGSGNTWLVDLTGSWHGEQSRLRHVARAGRLGRRQFPAVRLCRFGVGLCQHQRFGAG